MLQTRLQHIIPGALILTLAIVVAWLSFTEEPADSFLFPRVVSCVFCVLALWNFARASLGYAKVGRGISIETAKNVLLGVAVILGSGLIKFTP